jgi:transposase
VQSDRLGPAEKRPVDAAILAQPLRADLPEAWIAPPAVRQLRALLRHRASLVRLDTQLRNRIHAVAADHGYDSTGSYWTGPGRGWLAELDLPPVSREIVTGALAFTGALAPVIERPDREVRAQAKADPRVKVLTALPGVGEFTALVMLAEIGDITRFPSARKLTRAYHLLAAAQAAQARTTTTPATGATGTSGDAPTHRGGSPGC